jgi:hypothetical protein
VDNQQRPAVVPDAYPIEIEVSKTVTTRVTIPARSCSAPARVDSKKPGEVEVKAKHNRLKPAARKIGFCKIASSVTMALSAADTGSAPADGSTPVRYKVKFLDGGELATDRSDKELQFAPVTLGRRSGRDGTAARDKVLASPET